MKAMNEIKALLMVKNSKPEEKAQNSSLES